MNTNFKFPSSASLLQPTDTLVVDIKSITRTLNEKLPTAFVPEQPGIYIKNIIKPLILPGTPIFNYKMVSISYQQAIDDIGKYDVLDDTGSVIISKQSKSIASLLSTIPTYSINIMNFIFYYIDDYLLDQSPWLLDNNSQDKLPYYLTEEGIQLYIHNVFDSYLDEIIYNITSFIRPDSFMMYDLKLINGSIYVHKLSDYRIYQWTVERENLNIEPFKDRDKLSTDKSEALAELLGDHRCSVYRILSDKQWELRKLSEEYEASVRMIIDE